MVDLKVEDVALGCARVREHLPQFVNNPRDLDPELFLAITIHLANCPFCQEELQRLREKVSRVTIG